jgi:hypothetical protein
VIKRNYEALEGNMNKYTKEKGKMEILTVKYMQRGEKL